MILTSESTPNFSLLNCKFACFSFSIVVSSGDMARLSCECLNIVLHIRGDQQPVNVSSLLLPPLANSVPFFEGNISEVQLDLGGISKVSLKNVAS